MLSQKTQRKLLEMLGTEAAKIEELMKDGEFDHEVTGVNVYNDTQLAELKANVKKGHEEAYPEILGKRLNEEYKLGLSNTDAKDLTKVYAAVKAQGHKDANVAESDKLKELNTSLENLRIQLMAKDGEISAISGKLKDREITDKYKALLPANRNKFLTDEEHVARLKNKIAFDEAGNVIDVATKAVFKDKMEKPRTNAAEIVNEIYSSNDGWLHPEQAPAGGGKRPLGTPGASGMGVNGKKDPLKMVAEIQERYDMTDPDQRALALNEMRTVQVQAAATS